MTSTDQRFARVGAVAAFVGLGVYALSAMLHPGTAPHLTEEAFAHYAEEPNWAAIHIGELLGVLLMTAAAIALAWRLRAGAGVWAALAAAAMVVFAGIYAVFIAVDGVALGIMVDRWALAGPERRELLYETAFAVRQIEAGLFAMQWLMFGIATGLFAAAFFASAERPLRPAIMAGMGALSVAASVGAVLFGIVQASLGYTATSMAFQAGLMVGIVWTLAVGVFLIRHPAPVAASGERDATRPDSRSQHPAAGHGSGRSV